jgi:hypothetical protein
MAAAQEVGVQVSAYLHGKVVVWARSSGVRLILPERSREISTVVTSRRSS